MRTRVYNHKTDGLCEWLNKTIKSMLRRVVDRKNCDMMLPHLIFALWEVPQAFTGFSPLELLHGWPCRIILDLTKDAWENQSCLYLSLIDHITFLKD